MYSKSYNQNPRDSVNIQSIFSSYLSPDEVIEWCGQPALKSKRTSSNIILGAIFSGFSLFWAIGAFQASQSIVFALFALPFFLAGLYVMFGQGTKKLRANTYYAVTNERCIIISNDKEMSFCDYRYSAMSGVSCIDGSIMLVPPVIDYSYNSRHRNTSNSDRAQQSIKTNFIDINEDAPKVCKIITLHISESQNENK